MSSYSNSLMAITLLAFAAVGGVLAVLLAGFIDFSDSEKEISAAASNVNTNTDIETAEYFPPRPRDAPKELQPTVLKGQRLLEVVPDVRKNTLKCSNCHFLDGITKGGRNGGFSLVGSAAVHPENLPDRITNCFKINLNSNGPSRDSPEMSALIAYLTWISKGVPVYAKVPWLGVNRLHTISPPDRIAGETTFKGICAQCHGPNGQGTPIAPPLWGELSFTTASEMTRIEVLAPFVALNMPRQNPTLSPEQATNVAGYLIAQPRPKPSQAAQPVSQ